MGCAQSKTEDVAATNPPEAETAAQVETEPVAVTEEAKGEEPATEESAPAAAEPEAEETKPETAPAKELFDVTGHEIDDAGVVFYIVEAVEGDASFKKRFSEFKALIVALGNPKNVPSLPGSGLGSKLRGKHNPALIKERETQLNVVVNAIGNDAELAETEAFKKFVE